MDMQDRIPEAASSLLHAVRISPENPDALYYYASGCRAKQHKEALATYEKLNAMEPQNLERSARPCRPVTWI